MRPLRPPRARGAAAEVPCQLTVETLAPGGAGVAHVEHQGQRRAVFVPSAAAGDVLSAAVDFSRRPARGRVLRVLTASPDRRAPGDVPCRHLTACGACDFMHLTRPAQEEAHRAFVQGSLPASLADEAALSTVAAAHATGYRTRARLHVVAKGGRIACGMHAMGTREPVVVDSCVVLSPALDAARASIPALLAGASGDGEAHIAMGRAESGLRAPVLTLEWRGEPLPAAVFARLDAAITGGQLAGAAISTVGARAPARLGRPAPVAPGADGEDVGLALGGFSQAHDETNLALAAAVAREVEELLALAGCAADGRALTELYAGSGNLTVLLARLAPGLLALESHGPACEALRENLARRGLRARVVQGDADAHAWSPTTRVAVLDPPRTGARAAVSSLARSAVTGVVMVSCDPPTLGRDLGVLAPRFELTRLTTFEMFPETSHVETLAVLRRRRPGRGGARGDAGAR